MSIHLEEKIQRLERELEITQSVIALYGNSFLSQPLLWLNQLRQAEWSGYQPQALRGPGSALPPPTAVCLRQVVFEVQRPNGMSSIIQENPNSAVYRIPAGVDLTQAKLLVSLVSR